MIYSNFNETIHGRTGDHSLASPAVLSEKARKNVEALEAFGEEADRRLEAMVAVGYCHLYGGEPVEFPAEWAWQAARSLQRVVMEATMAAGYLPTAVADVGQKEAEEIVAALLFSRMNIWAAMEGLFTVINGGHLINDDVCDLVQPGLNALDDMLRDNLELIGSLVDTKLLAHWRRGLGEWRSRLSLLPWWLAGRLEEAAARGRQRADSRDVLAAQIAD